MRIGVLEWASCGGLHDTAELCDSIRLEGWAMCRAALLSLVRGGHQAVALLAPRCAADRRVSGYPTEELELFELTAGHDLCNEWQRVYASCDYTLVIAPECDGILRGLLSWCRQNELRTCNCSESFALHAGDKLIAAQLFQTHGIPHPPTHRLSDAQREWPTDAHSDREATWVVKPTDGVGCAGLLRVTANQLAALAADRGWSERDVDRWIVQPWLAGQACSRAAIIDRSGRPHWLPVTRQNLAVDDGGISYLGGTVEPALADNIPELDQLLTRALSALGGQPLGWVGIDFLYDAGNQQQPLTVIEINPRLTTSFVGLASAGAPNLAATIIAAAHGAPVELPTHWQAIHFTAAGQTGPA